MLDINTGECVKTFKGHNSYTWDMRILDHARFVTCSADHTIKIWEIETGKCLKTIHTNYNAQYSQDDNDVTCIETLSNDRICCYFQDQNYFRIFSAKSGVCLKVLETQNARVRVFRNLTNDRMMIASDATIKIWDLSNDKCVKTLFGHEYQVCCLEKLSNDKILSGSADNTIKIWNVKTGECIQTLNGHSDTVNCVSVLSEEIIISGSADKTIKVWCLKTNSCIMTLDGHSNSVISVKTLTEYRIVSSSNDMTIKIWDLVSGKCIETFNKANNEELAYDIELM